MPTTTRGYPYPSGVDNADVPGDMQALAEAIDADHHTFDASGITLGGDTGFYRALADFLRTDDNFQSTKLIEAAQGLTGSTVIGRVGPSNEGGVRVDGDTSFYRLAADSWKSDDTLEVLGLGVGITAAAGGSARIGDRLAVGSAAIDSNKPLIVGTSGANGNGAHVTNGGTWTNGTSLRKFKEGFRDYADLLARIRRIEVKEWAYIESGERHIGPMADDFYREFPDVMADEHERLASLDVAGLALWGVQALLRRFEALEAAPA